MSTVTTETVKGVVRHVRIITLDPADQFRLSTPGIDSYTQGHGARPIRIIAQRNFTFGKNQDLGLPVDAAGNVAKPKKGKAVADEIHVWYENLRPDLMAEGRSYPFSYTRLNKEDQVRVDALIKKHPLPDEASVVFQ